MEMFEKLVKTKTNFKTSPAKVFCCITGHLVFCYSKLGTKKTVKDDLDLFSSDDEWSKSNPVPVKKAKKMKTTPYPAGATANHIQPRQPPTISDRCSIL